MANKILTGIQFMNEEKISFCFPRYSQNRLHCYDYYDFSNLSELLNFAEGEGRFWWNERAVNFPMGKKRKLVDVYFPMISVKSFLPEFRTEINVGYPDYNVSLYIPCDRAPNPTEDYEDYIDNVLFKSHVVALLEAQKLWERWQNHKGSDRDFIKQVEQETWGKHPYFDLSLPEIKQAIKAGKLT